MKVVKNIDGSQELQADIDKIFDIKRNGTANPARQKRERGDLINLYKIVNGIEKLEKQNLVMMEVETRQMRGH